MKRLPHHIKNVLQSCVVILSLQSVASGLEIGDEVSVEALGKAHFIQGAAPEKWEEGKPEDTSEGGAEENGSNTLEQLLESTEEASLPTAPTGEGEERRMT